MRESDERISRERFIRMGGALGVSVAAASILGACEGSSSEQSAKASGNKSEATAGQEIARTSKIPENSAANFTAAGNPAVLIHQQAGRFVAYSAMCTHQACTVAYQQSTGDLTCPCHGSVFDPSKGGAVVSGPAPVPLPQIPIKVRSGRVYRA